MSKRGKILAGIFFVFFVCLVTWVVRTTPSAPPPEERIDPPKTMEYEGNTITEEKKGVKLWELTSEKIVVEADSQDAEFEKVTGKFYREDGKILELTADKGKYNQKSRDVHVEGNVILTNQEDGSKLTSKNLDWLGGEEKLIAKEDVKISKEDMRAFGDYAESKDGFSHFILKGHARLLKGVKEDSEEKK